jgi:hypothetical protein
LLDEGFCGRFGGQIFLRGYNTQLVREEAMIIESSMVQGKDVRQEEWNGQYSSNAQQWLDGYYLTKDNAFKLNEKKSRNSKRNYFSEACPFCSLTVKKKFETGRSG